MRVFITGGAGFIGSHLADAYVERGDEVFILDDLSTGKHRQHPAPPRASAVPLHDRERAPRPHGRRAGRSVRRGFPPGGGGRREVDRREPGPHHRNERPRRRSRARPGEQEEEEGADRLHVRGLRPERGRAVSRGRQPRPGRDQQGTLELRLLEGDRRVPGAGLLARAQAADGAGPAVQHGGAASDGSVRHGRADVRQAGAHRPADHDPRRRHAVALLHRRRATWSRP